MSQIFKVRKKLAKISSTKGKTSDSKSTLSLNNNNNNNNNENSSNKESSSKSEDDISENLKNLPQFCEKLEIMIENANEVLQRAYEDEYPRILRNRLKRNVDELMCLQNEIKTIWDNINSMKMQIAAVKYNIEAHKKRMEIIKEEKYRTRFLLSAETNKYEKNLRNLRENATSQGTSTTMAGNLSRPSSSLPPPPPLTLNVPTDSENANKSSMDRSLRPSNRTFIGPIYKKPKHVRHKRESTQSDNGVTVYLHPINELDKSESSHSPISRHSTPNASIINFSWLNTAQSDTATGSIISETNSLFVFGSDGHIDDVD